MGPQSCTPHSDTQILLAKYARVYCLSVFPSNASPNRCIAFESQALVCIRHNISIAIVSQDLNEFGWISAVNCYMAPFAESDEV